MKHVRLVSLRKAESDGTFLEEIQAINTLLTTVFDFILDFTSQKEKTPAANA